VTQSKFRISLLILPLLLALPLAGIQAQPAAASDVESIDSIITAVYEAISGDAGEARNWDRFTSLFVADATLSAVVPNAEGFERQITNPQTFAQASGPTLERDGFHETEIHRVTEQYGQIAHAFSTYISKRSAQDAEPFDRGINSFQLMFDGSRWWVVSIYWQSETEQNPIPGRYGG